MISYFLKMLRQCPKKPNVNFCIHAKVTNSWRILFMCVQKLNKIDAKSDSLLTV